MSQIGKSGFASLVILQTPGRVVRDSPKSDTCTVYLNITDSVSGARAKGLVGMTVQFGQYTSYFRAARANPGSPLCSWCYPEEVILPLRGGVYGGLTRNCPALCGGFWSGDLSEGNPGIDMVISAA
jgi:hypothetical protein